MRTKQYRTTIPYDPSTGGLDALRWYTRESFEHTIAGDNMVLIDYREEEADLAKVPPKVREQYPDHAWFTFTATAKLPEEVEALLSRRHGDATSA